MYYAVEIDLHGIFYLKSCVTEYFQKKFHYIFQLTMLNYPFFTG